MRRKSRLGVAAAALSATQACYNYVPLETTTPPVGERIAFEISDRGRVGLSNRFGPGLAQIEGTLVGNQGNDYVINVYRVSQISGSSAIWSGEETRLDREYVGQVRSRQLSKLRTGLLIGGLAAGVALLTAQGLSGTFSGAPDPAPPVQPANLRIPFRIPLHW